MTDQDATRPHFGPSHEANQEYHAVSGLAVASLVFGLLSVAALIDPLAWLLPLTGILLALLAFWRLAQRRPELVGRKAAVIGLLLSLFFGGIATGHWAVYRWMLAYEARQVDMAWFDYFAEGQPQLAHQLTLKPDDRQPPGTDAWTAYRTSRSLHDALAKDVAEPLSRTLLALGKKATVRFYATETVRHTPLETVVVGLYAVTFNDAGKKTSFFVRLYTKRVPATIAGRTPWQIIGITSGVDPSKERDKDFDPL
ncbi:MAG: DUF4190 domain-containing protein [Pirellulales bacterium]|nr:DUF4190 domain-containing protein [Pirellulales bacterium]